MPQPAILTEGLAKSYGSVHALRGVDIVVPQATVLGLLGPNGAGKTTAVRILATLLLPDAGRALVAGRDVVHEPDAVRSQVGLTGQYAAVDENLTGRENLELVGRLLHMGRGAARARADELLDAFELSDAGRRPARTYSGGMRRRLDLAASLVGRPTVLFLDEPTTGLDPRSRVGLWDVIAGLVADGTTILLTTQYLEEADRLADRIAVIDDGLVIAEGTSAQLKDRLGGDVIEMRLVEPGRASEAIALLSPLAAAEPRARGRNRSSDDPGAPRRGSPDRGRPPARRREPGGRRAVDAPTEPRRRVLGPHRPSDGHRPCSGRGNRSERPLRPPPAEESSMTATMRTIPLATSAVARPRSLSWIATDAVTIAWRNLLQVIRNPQLAVIDTITPIMFVLLFAFVFGGAILVPGGNYIAYLMPGIFVQTVVFGATGTAVGLAEDMQKGIIDRFRSLPMAPSAVLIGRTFSDALRNLYTVLVITVVGYVIGFRFEGGLPAAVLALGLVVGFGYSISWISANIGLITKSAQAAQGAIFIPIFPLTFASSAFVPVATMPELAAPDRRGESGDGGGERLAGPRERGRRRRDGRGRAGLDRGAGRRLRPDRAAELPPPGVVWATQGECRPAEPSTLPSTLRIPIGQRGGSHGTRRRRHRFRGGPDARAGRGGRGAGGPADRAVWQRGVAGRG